MYYFSLDFRYNLTPMSTRGDRVLWNIIELLLYTILALTDMDMN
jgi:hypothetical protein